MVSWTGQNVKVELGLAGFCIPVYEDILKKLVPMTTTPLLPPGSYTLNFTLQTRLDTARVTSSLELVFSINFS